MVDEFIVYDDVQYTKRDWRNRNIIKTRDGLKWLTIPVEVKGKYNQTIKETRVSNNKWASKHWETLRHTYSPAPFFNDYAARLEEMYIRARELELLSEINLLFMREIGEYLGIKTRISFSSDYKLEGERSHRAMNICLQADAGEYLTGPSAISYLDIAAFTRAGIKVKWMDYSGYKEYPQLYSPFVHEVSIVDLIFNTGSNSIKYLKSFS